MENWEKELEKLPKKLDSCFAVVARWLHTHNDQTPETLLSQLDALGQPGRDLIAAIGGLEYGDRSKDNFFATKGAKDMRAIHQMLELLQKEDQQNWSPGIERLANWLAALAGDKEGGTQ